MEILYFPPQLISEILPWLRNFVRVLKPIHKDHGITDDEMDRLEAILAAMEYASGRHDANNEAASGFRSDRDTIWWGDQERPNLTKVIWTTQANTILAADIPAEVAPNAYVFVKNIVMRLRQQPSVTESLAQQLGILPRPRTKNSDDNYVPVLSGTIQNGKAVLDCPVKGFAGYEVWRDRTNTNHFTRIDKAVDRTWTDDEPLPEGVNAELRHYKVRMLDTSNNPVGEFSNIVALTVSRVV